MTFADGSPVSCGVVGTDEELCLVVSSLDGRDHELSGSVVGDVLPAE